MKLLTIVYLLMALSWSLCYGQNAKIISAAKQLVPPGTGPELPVASLARGLIDRDGNLAVSPATIAALAAAKDYTATIAGGSAPSFAPSVTQRTFRHTPTTNETFIGVTTNAEKGELYNLVVTTSGTNSYQLVFGTNFSPVGPLTTGNVTATVFTLQFVYDGTLFREVSRTRISTAGIALTSSANVTMYWGDGVKLFHFTPTGAVTLAAANVARAGEVFSVKITTSGTTSYVVTMGSNLRTTGALSTGTTNGKTFMLTFQSDGTYWNEISRTTAM